MGIVGGFVARFLMQLVVDLLLIGGVERGGNTLLKSNGNKNNMLMRMIVILFNMRGNGVFYFLVDWIVGNLYFFRF